MCVFSNKRKHRLRGGEVLTPKVGNIACAAGGQEEGNLAVFSLLSITLFPLSLRWRPGCYAPLLRTGTAAKEIRGAEAEGICADGFASYSRKSGCILSEENAGVYVGKVGASCPVRDFGVRAGRLFCSCGLGGNRKQVLSLCAQRAPLKKGSGVIRKRGETIGLSPFVRLRRAAAHFLCFGKSTPPAVGNRTPRRAGNVSLSMPKHKKRTACRRFFFVCLETDGGLF